MQVILADANYNRLTGRCHHLGSLRHGLLGCQPDDLTGDSMRILIAEDEPTLGEALVEVLEDAGHSVDLAATGTLARHLVALSPYDLILLDRSLPPPGGDQLVAEWHTAHLATPIVLMSGDSRGQPQAFPGCGFLAKPFSFTALLGLVAEVAAATTPASSDPAQAPPK